MIPPPPEKKYGFCSPFCGLHGFFLFVYFKYMRSSSAVSDNFLHCVFLLDHLRICSHFRMSYSLPHRALQKVLFNFPHILFSSAAQSCQTLCDLLKWSTPGLPVHHQLLHITIKLTSIEWVMPPSYLFLWCHLFLLPPIPANIRVFSCEPTLHMRWPKNWSFSFSITFQRIPRADLL